MNTTNDPRHSVRALLDAQTAKGRHTLRTAKDRLARHLITVGGGLVIFAVVLIFFYLLSVVAPIFHSASLQQEFRTQSSSPNTVLLTLDEYGELAAHYGADGHVRFINTVTGELRLDVPLPIAHGVQISSAVVLDRISGRVALGLSDGTALLATQAFSLHYGNDGTRRIDPSLSFPFGDTPIILDTQRRALHHLVGASDEDSIKLAARASSQEWVLQSFEIEENLLDETLTLNQAGRHLVSTEQASTFAQLEPSGRWLYLGAGSGRVEAWEWRDGESPRQVQSVYVNDQQSRLTEMKLLLGGISLLVGDSKGRITQWFRVRDEHNEFALKPVRTFDLGNSAITRIVPEPRRKGFTALNQEGEFGIFYTTSSRTLLTEKMPAHFQHIELNARANRLIALDDQGSTYRFVIDNEHPEISWSALWHEVWYESYDEAGYTWQSSAGTDDFEPKMSLMPLAFGTMKAAFCAMMIALPIGIFGAMYTAFFMSASMRGMVKPMVEIMAALPSVILGFLAGLWLAPAVEANLPGTFALLLFLPLFIVGFGWAWQFAPRFLRHRISEGWQAALLLPVVMFAGYLCFAISPWLEQHLFDGNAPRFLTDVLHIDFEQRNSLIVGIAMGFAVIPSVFSIAEDAIFGVPKSLVNGSLALGASPWQTMVRVVLPTASPGIFSAVMIGLGRAVGETMIVLMATGNTPIMEANIFEGLRSLSANIAVEMPEAEVGSSHYRILFVSALVLFSFTLVFNTVAEIVRARLRRKYGSL